MRNKGAFFFAIFVWSLAIVFFFYEFFLRIFLGTIATDIIASLHLTVRQFSIVAASYYVIYSAMQTPVGILADKYGPRKILTFACFITAFGVFWLGWAQGFYSAMMSRLLIGFGSSFAFVALLLLALNWFERKHFAFLCGLAQLLGATGPILAGAPLALAMEKLNHDWRLICFWMGGFGVLLTGVIYAFLRDKPKDKKNEIFFITPHASLKQELLELLRNSQVWPILLYSGCIYVSIPLLAAYWGTTYLETRGFARPSAAFMISMLWIGFSFGAVFIGKVSDKIKRRKPFLILNSVLGMIFSSFVLYFPGNKEWFLSLFFAFIGFASAGQSLTFAVISEQVPKKLHALALGLNNTAIMLFAAVIPTFASSIIQSMSVDKTHLSFQSFVYGLSAMPIMFFIAFLFALFGIRETFCKQQKGVDTIKL